VRATVPDELTILAEENLKEAFPNSGPRELGDHRVESVASAVFRVRSAVVPDEFNFLLNPRHPDFVRIVIEPPTPFLFDERLFVAK
jgi:RES domain-containing protein